MARLNESLLDKPEFSDPPKPPTDVDTNATAKTNLEKLQEEIEKKNQELKKLNQDLLISQKETMQNSQEKGFSQNKIRYIFVEDLMNRHFISVR